MNSASKFTQNKLGIKLLLKKVTVKETARRNMLLC